MREIKFNATHGELKYWVSTNCKMRAGATGGYKSNGYVKRKVTAHPFPDKRGYVLEHRLVVEAHKKEFLHKEAVIHHLNGVRDDNRLSNLQLLTSQSEHATIGLTGQRNPNGQFVALDPKFNEKKFRLFNKNTGMTEIYTLNKLIATTFRRAQFNYLGEWTGLKDKNGKEIFEGDVIRVFMGMSAAGTNSLGEEEPETRIEYTKTVVWKNCGFDWEVGGGSMLVHGNCKYFEIIGNVHENQELIKERKP